MRFERSWHKSYAPGVPRDPAFEKITMPEFLTRTAQRFPSRTALVFMGKKITYRELEALVNRFAKALMGLGVKAGDKVAMLLPNMPQLVIANYAAMRIGAVPVPCNPLYTEHELTHQLSDSDSTVLIALDLRLPLVEDLKGKTGIRSIVACHITDFLPFPGNMVIRYLHPGLYLKVQQGAGMHEFLPLIEKQPDTTVENAAAWDEVGAMIYTGGTTGISKGVMMTHANISCNVQQLRAAFPEAKDGEESMMAVFPFFHSAGWTGMQNLSILAGWTDILVPRPDVPVIAQTLKKQKPTLLPGVPTVYVGLLAGEEFRTLDLSSVKAFLAGAAPLPLKVIDKLKAVRNCPVINVYGLTEISPMGTATPWGGDEKPGTVGVPLPGTDLKIVDVETGTQELPAGEAGEICFKGPQVMKGYYKQPAETAAVLKDEWLFTGDIGYLDADGYLTIVDRKKELIVASGFNVYPSEVDAVLLAHPKVLEACTIGVPDEYRGETVKSYIVLKAGETATAEEIIAFCRETLTAYKVPKIIEFIDELPKSAVGKVLRREIRELDRSKREKKETAS
ncbi:MAG: long-chain fatty acid--CoA ligase [Deltaproteobacteria bacterium]|nr:long-chain fatty acid--CoA ligase [Deltaproteobacteria bacterium]